MRSVSCSPRRSPHRV